ncbi:TetR family transcriptional regulator C-terminal domain-containing protein [Arthrobacter sp. efr-133-TYG-104]|uniref:TetR/AcrR family transcriptional regulator n=1 Tax=Arthrobacter sp. efr-133-TYG-104 TaxID=3040324 RepID=UPI002550AB72|nr:TetR family transcriptional regulator C-terminal domain-containing protein [Arthrobacter sp. efr-133-TYG-104]
MSNTPRKPSSRKAPHERAQEITDAARAIALEEGLGAITLRGVAARIGVASGLIAHYEPSVEALVARIFGSIVSEEIAEVRSTLEVIAGPGARLGYLVETMLEAKRLDVTAVWVDAWTLGRRSELLAATVRSQMDAWQDVIRVVLDEGQAAGEFSMPDAQAVAWQILGMVDGLNAQALVRWEGVPDRGTHLARAVEVMVGAADGLLAVD